jgi:hypothetical protein
MFDFGAKRIFFTDINLSASIGDIGFCGIAGTAKKACREYRLGALRQIWLPNGLATLPAKREEPPSSHPDGSE